VATLGGLRAAAEPKPSRSLDEQTPMQMQRGFSCAGLFGIELRPYAPCISSGRNPPGPAWQEDRSRPLLSAGRYRSSSPVRLPGHHPGTASTGLRRRGAHQAVFERSAAPDRGRPGSRIGIGLPVIMIEALVHFFVANEVGGVLTAHSPIAVRSSAICSVSHLQIRGINGDKGVNLGAMSE
jgi:hypothetical protein